MHIQRRKERGSTVYRKDSTNDYWRPAFNFEKSKGGGLCLGRPSLLRATPLLSTLLLLLIAESMLPIRLLTRSWAPEVVIAPALGIVAGVCSIGRHAGGALLRSRRMSAGGLRRGQSPSGCGSLECDATEPCD